VINDFNRKSLIGLAFILQYSTAELFKTSHGTLGFQQKTVWESVP